MVIIDSSVLIDHMARRSNPWTNWLAQRRYVERFGITSLILCEILQDLRHEEQLLPARRFLTQFRVFELGSEDLAVTSALNYRALRRMGYTVRSTIDCITATFCIGEGHMLFHRDRDFDVFEEHLGLHVLHPPTMKIN